MEHFLHFPGHTLFSMAVVALLVAAGLILYAWRLKTGVGKRDRIALVVLRLIALAGVVGAYLQPTEREEEVFRRKSRVVVLVDESTSMGVSGDGAATRAEEVAGFFREHGGWFEGVTERHDVTCYAFASHGREVRCDSLSAPLSPAGGSTDISLSLEEALKGVNPREVGGVLLFTDGLDNGDLARAAVTPGAGFVQRAWPAGMPGPVFAFVPAAGDLQRNVAISTVKGLEYSVSRNLTEVKVLVRSTGYASGTLTATLSEAGREVDKADVPVEEARFGAAATLSFLPREPGRRAMEVAVSAMPGEATWADNARIEVVDVVRDRLRVLHVAGHPSWDERFLREYLKGRREVQLVSFHTLRAPDAWTSTPDDETTLIPFPADELFIKYIEGFDVVILQDYELPEFDRDRFAGSLQRYVQGGGALLSIGGGYSFGARGLWPAHLDPVLPVTAPKSIGHGMVEGRLAVEVPAEGRRHPAMGGARLLELLGRAPPVRAINQVGGGARGTTTLLAAAPEGAAGQRLPLAVVAEKGKGRVAAILTDTLWAWSFDPTLGELYGLFMDAVIAHLTRDPTAAALTVTVSRTRVVPGGEVRVSIAAASGIDGASIDVLREGKGGRLDAVGEPKEVAIGADGKAEVVLTPAGAGTFRVRARAHRGESLQEASEVFVVGPTPEEVSRILPSRQHVGVLARVAGGAVLDLRNPGLDEVVLKPEVVARVGILSDVPVWNHPIVLAILLLALGLEWFMERKIGYT